MAVRPMTRNVERIVPRMTAEDPRRMNYVNVGEGERLLSLIGGSALVVYGLARRDWTGAGLALPGAALIFRGLTGHSFLYQALDVSSVEKSPRTLSSLPGDKGIRIRRSVTIERPAADLYRFWHNVENAPRYMPYIQSVRLTGESTSHWTASVPGGKLLEWDSKITRDAENMLIAWETERKALIGHAGEVRFMPAPDNLGTVVQLEMRFPQVGGPLAASVGKLLGRLPEQQVRETLRRFKSLMEAGEIPTNDRQPRGK